MQAQKTNMNMMALPLSLQAYATYIYRGNFWRSLWSFIIVTLQHNGDFRAGAMCVQEIRATQGTIAAVSLAPHRKC
jgi:hypothetical protein